VNGDVAAPEDITERLILDQAFPLFDTGWFFLMAKPAPFLPQSGIQRGKSVAIPASC
jgi:hypothetical protein